MSVPLLRQEVRYRTAVWLGAAAFTVLLTYASIARHAHYSTQVFDLGIFDQGLWLLSTFKNPFVTLRGLNLFGDHSSYLMVPLVPLYWIWSNVRLLMIVTVAALGIGAVLAYEVARAEGVRPSLAGVVALTYLLHPAVAWNAWDNFHPEVIALALLLGAHLLFLRGRTGWGMVAVLLVLAAKEDAALIVVPYGLYLWWRLRNPRPGLPIVLIGAAAFVLNVTVLLPAFSPSGDLIYLNRYAQFGDSLPSALVGMATSPLAVLRELTTFPRLMYLLVMVTPISLALLAPEVLLIGIPITAANLLSVHGYQYDVRFHYTVYLIAVLVIAAAVGARRLQRRLSGRSLALVLASSVALAAVGLVVAGPVPDGPFLPGVDDRHPSMANPWGWSSLRPEMIDEAIAQIPSDAVVSADYTVAPHLAHRTTIYMFPNPFVRRFWSIPGDPLPPADEVEWIVVRPLIARTTPEVGDGLEQAERAGFERVVDNEEVIVLRR